MHRFSILLIGAAGLVACQKGGAGASSAEGSSHPLVGSTAPAFELTEHGGSARITPAQSQGKVTIIDFWATWCEPCKDSFPVYEEIVRENGGEVVVIAISEDEKPDGIAAFRAETGVTFPIVWDEGQTVAGQYEPSTMPTSYLVDRAGVVRYVHVGFTQGDAETLRAQVSALLE